MRKFQPKKASHLLLSSLMLFALIAVCNCVQSCKATRAITTTSTCTICQDSTKTSATIQTKTVEDYVGVKK